MPSSMPAVFVHGVPDTQRVWSAVIARLERNDVVMLSRPGFGGPAPEGFDATMPLHGRIVPLAELHRMIGRSN